jgi:hypothetical protein
MPIKLCTNNGKQGKQWGDSGKCYTGKNANAKATKQAAAAFVNGYKEKGVKNGK